MAKYKADPFYVVKVRDNRVNFDINGFYETSKADEIAALDKLTPTWINRVDKDEPKKVAEEPAPKDKPKAPAKKSSKK